MSLSLDLRKRLIKAYENGEGSIRQLSERFSVGKTTLFELLKRYRETGSLDAISPPGRNRMIDEKKAVILKNLLLKDNEKTLDELCEAFAKKTSMEVSISTMHRACERMNIRYKKNIISSRTKAS